jgi:hypothetical protein
LERVIRWVGLPSVPAACPVLFELVVVLFGVFEDFFGVDSKVNVLVVALECFRAL